MLPVFRKAPSLPTLNAAATSCPFYESLGMQGQVRRRAEGDVKGPVLHGRAEFLAGTGAAPLQASHYGTRLNGCVASADWSALMFYPET